eukprot:CFRG3433T1
MAQYLPPPPYYKKYTNTAVDSGTVPKPPPIPEKTYTTFGVEKEATGMVTLPWKQSLLLEMEPHYLQLYPNKDDDSNPRAKDFDHRAELKKLNRSIVLNYMQLLNVLTTDPSHYMTVFNQLAGLFHNMHALINDCRPHQARETIRAMMEAQVVRKENCVQDLQMYFDAVTSALRECLEAVQPCNVDDIVKEYTRNCLDVENIVGSIRGKPKFSKEASAAMDTDRDYELSNSDDKVYSATMIARLSNLVDTITEEECDDCLAERTHGIALNP